MSDKFERERIKAERERIKEELKEKYKENFKPCTPIFASQNSVEEYLGELDADVEWSNDSERAYAQFLHTDVYKRFSKTENLILMGRTGTGKSSILHRYAYAVNTHEGTTEFSIAIVIAFEKFFKVLQLYDFDNCNLDSYISNGIELIMTLQIMQSLVIKYNEDKDSLKTFEKEIRVLDEYLKRKYIFNYTDIVKMISERMDFSNDPNTELRIAIHNLKKAYEGIQDEDIKISLNSILSKHKILLLADSVDFYDITERKVVVINKALVNMAFDFYKSWKKTNILLKVAIPSEVYTHIIEQIAAKRKSKVVAIEWKYKDLIKMLAIKILFFFISQEEKYKFAHDLICNYEIHDFYNYQTALEFLHKMLPKTCRACIPMCFETLPYCIRHTQKKPRQIITIFNSFIDKICQEEQYDYFIKNSDSISDYIHKVQKDIINDALNMYNTLAKEKVLSIVKSVLSHKRNFLENIELKAAIKEASNIFNVVGLSEEDVKQILIESGLVGQVHTNGYVKENSKLFKNTQVIKVSIALFEYQIKDTLPLRNTGVEYVLHPMCYEYYENEIDYNALVYPAPADDLEDNIISKLEREDVIF